MCPLHLKYVTALYLSNAELVSLMEVILFFPKKWVVLKSRLLRYAATKSLGKQYNRTVENDQLPR